MARKNERKNNSKRKDWMFITSGKRMKFMCVCFRKVEKVFRWRHWKKKKIQSKTIPWKSIEMQRYIYFPQRATLFLRFSFRNFHHFYWGNSIRAARTLPISDERGKIMEICAAICVCSCALCDSSNNEYIKIDSSWNCGTFVENKHVEKIVRQQQQRRWNNDTTINTLSGHWHSQLNPIERHCNCCCCKRKLTQWNRNYSTLFARSA